MARDYVYYVELDEGEVLQSLKNIETGINALVSQGDAAFKKIEKTASTTYQQTGHAAQAATNVQIASIQRVVQAEETAAQRIRRQIKEQAVDDGALARAKIDNAMKVFKARQQESSAAVKATQQASSGLGAYTNQIRQAGFALQRFGVGGVAAWGEIFAAVGPVGIAIGAVLVPLVALTKAFKALADAAVETFKKIIQGSFEAGKEVQGMKAQFTAIFDNQENVADAVYNRVRQISETIGQDATQLAKTFIPDVESLDQLESIIKDAAALAAYKPEQGITGATIALQEVLAGQYISFEKRFNVSPEVIANIKKLQEQYGLIEGGLMGIDDWLQKTGRDIETVGDTWTIQLGKVQELLHTLLGVAGEPIIDALTEQATRLFETLDEHRDELAVVFNALGQALAGIVNVLGDELIPILQGIDPENAMRLADSIRDIGSGIELIVKLAPGLGGASDSFAGMADSIRPINFLLLGVAEGFNVINTALAGIKQATINKFGFLAAAALAVTGQTEAAAALTMQIGDLSDVAEEMALTFSKGQLEIIDWHNSIKEAHDENRAFAESLNEDTSAAEDLADAISKLNKANSDLGAAQDALTQAQADQAEEQKKLADELTQDLMEAQLKRSRALLDLEQDTAEKRVDAARDNVRKLQKIYRDYQDDLAKAALDLSRDEEDIARKSAREQEDVDRESAKKKLEIEQDFRSKLDEIRRKFLFDAEEAVRQNDAVEFLRIKRRMEFELNEARLKRDQDIQEEDQAAQEKRDEQRVALQREIEDAQIANQRKLEDLRNSLAERVREQGIAYAQEMADIRIQEERKREEINKAMARQIEDLNRNFQERLRVIKKSLDDEVAAYQAAAIKMMAAAAAVAAARARLGRGGSAFSGAEASGVGSSTPGGVNPGTHPSTGRKLGGTVRQNEPVLVGEPLPGNKPNPEVFIPNSSGLVHSLNRMMASMPSRSMGGSTIIDNSRTIEAPISLNDPNSFSAVQWAQIDNRITRMLQKVYQ